MIEPSFGYRKENLSDFVLEETDHQLGRYCVDR
jgi:hypothetical protein